MVGDPVFRGTRVPVHMIAELAVPSRGPIASHASFAGSAASEKDVDREIRPRFREARPELLDNLLVRFGEKQRFRKMPDRLRREVKLI